MSLQYDIYLENFLIPNAVLLYICIPKNISPTDNLD